MQPKAEQGPGIATTRAIPAGMLEKMDGMDCRPGQANNPVATPEYLAAMIGTVSSTKAKAQPGRRPDGRLEKPLARSGAD